MTLGGIVQLTRNRGRVFFLVFYEMFQRFNFYGVQAIMFLFLKHELDLELHNAIGVYHIYVGLSCLVPIIGTIIADLYMNKAMSIIVISMYAMAGNILIVLASTTFGEFGLKDELFLNVSVLMSFGLLLRAIGGGGVREIVRSLGNDQFKLPAENRHLLNFHHLLYFFMTVGTLAAFIVPPVLRMHVPCLGQLYCFPLAFGVPAMFLVFATAILMCGYRALDKFKPGRIATVEFARCIKAALGNRGSGGRRWVNASHAYNNWFIDEVHETVRVLWLFLTLPIFWALFELTGSLWVYQAMQMLGTVSKKNNWYVEPDQMQALIPIVALILMPILEHILYPILNRCKYVLSTPKQRMMFGSILAILAFVGAALVELNIEPTHSSAPRAGEANLILVNPFLCDIKFASDIPHLATNELKYMDAWMSPTVPVTGVQPLHYVVTNSIADCHFNIRFLGNTSLVEGLTLVISTTIYAQLEDELGINRIHFPYPDDLVFHSVDRCDLQLARVGVVYSMQRVFPYAFPKSELRYPLSFDLVVGQGRRWSMQNNVTLYLDPNHSSVDILHLTPAKYHVTITKPTPIDGKLSMTLARGEVGIIMVKWNNDLLRYSYTTIVQPLNVSMWWQAPQYVLIGLAEFLFPFTLLEYAHQQVSEKMRPVLTSFWLLSIALGNLLVSGVTFPNPFRRKFWYYVLFACLMLVDCVLLLILLYKYVPSEEVVKERERREREEEEEEEEEGKEREKKPGNEQLEANG